ncbi:histone-like nucleoid-structuring protein Lsr2 [Nocardiopsis suaedae]|uniref:Lsr2 family protein n=1 Tax=Nocardiopsis suaedae TaxID=3018444 RepID=A0ABT4TJQ9_9ACTN|nr:Lsr2 family protein [Nocardiopsis suaedae]MDA2804650.1 Lsr2 family protein [Nocardiopsis suaedae]
MAQKVQVLLVDDLDGGEADETVAFGVDGTSYEIDLSTDNATTLRELLAPYVSAARKAPAKAGRGGRRQQRSAPSRERSAEIRAWAKAQGKQVNERGRIPAAIVAEYEAAQGR